MRMAKLWFDDLEALLATRQSPEWKESSADEVNFIDHSKVAYFGAASYMSRAASVWNNARGAIASTEPLT
jgi:hypothetical protein